MRLELESRSFFVFFPACVKSSHHTPLYAYCFLLGGSIQLYVCNLMHNDFLDSLDLDLWACGKHDFLFFSGFLFTLHCINIYLGSTWSDVCICPALASLFTYTILLWDRNPGLLFLFPSFLLGA